MTHSSPAAEQPFVQTTVARLGQFISQSGNIRDTFQLLWRRRMMILGLIVVAMGIAMVVVKQLVPMYTATTKVILEGRTAQIVNFREVVGDLRVNQFTFRGEVEVISSRALAQRVIDELKLDQQPFFNPALRSDRSWLNALNPLRWINEAYRSVFPPPPVEENPELVEQRKRNRLIDRFLGNLAVRTVTLSPVIQISYTTPDPALSAKIANTLADVYITSQMDAKFEATRKAAVWLNERLGDLRDKVRDTERAVADYRASHGLVAGGGSSLTEEKLSDLNSRYILAQSERAEVEARYEQVKRVLSSGGSLDATPDVLQSPVVQRLLEQEATLNRELAELSTRYGERHPKMIDARSQLDDLRRKIRAEVSKVASALKSELVVASTREKALGEAIGKAEGQAATEGTASVTLRELEREAEANRLIYENFLNRFKETSQRAAILRQRVHDADHRGDNVEHHLRRPGGLSGSRQWRRHLLFRDNPRRRRRQRFLHDPEYRDGYGPGAPFRDRDGL